MGFMGVAGRLWVPVKPGAGGANVILRSASSNVRTCCVRSSVDILTLCEEMEWKSDRMTLFEGADWAGTSQVIADESGIFVQMKDMIWSKFRNLDDNGVWSWKRDYKKGGE